MICLNNYTIQQTNSMVMSCSHPICEHCINSICIDQSIVCPVCWKMTDLQNNSQNLLCKSNRNSLNGQTRATTMLEENSVLRHQPVDELKKKPPNIEEKTFIIKIKNADHGVQKMTNMSIEGNEQQAKNLNTVFKEVIYHESSDLHKQQIDSNQIEIEIINGKLRLKVPIDHSDQPSKCLNEEINPPKADFKITPKKQYGEQGTAEIKIRPTEKGENINGTETTPIQVTNFEKKDDSSQLITVLPFGKKHCFIPKFGAHKVPSKHCRVKIMSVFDPYRLYIQIVDDDLRRLDSLNKQLMLQFQSLSRAALKSSSIKNPVEGDVCAVLYDGFWQRGMIQFRIMYENVYQNAQIIIVDTGFCCVVPQRHIQPLHPAYLELPAQAVCCKLSNVLRLEQKDNGKQILEKVGHCWPSHIRDLVQTKKGKMANISVLDYVYGDVGSTSTTSEATLLVHMVVDGESTSVNQQIDCATAEAVSGKNGYQSSKLVPQTYTSLPAKTRRRRSRKSTKAHADNRIPVPETHSTAPTDAIVPNDIRVVVKTVSPSRSTSNSSYPSSVTSGQKKREVEQKSQPSRIAMWIFADLKTILPHSFDGIITWVDDNGGFYVHDCRWSKRLSLIRDTLNATLIRSNPIKDGLRCQPEDPCLAKYQNNWYRAIIKAVSKARNTAIVFFVDYGATVDVQLRDIRMDTTLKNIPVHTFRCSLYNLMPLGAKFDVSATWSDAVISYFHTTVVNQEFNMTVKSYSPLTIAMRFLKNSMDLTDFMVTARAGEYINHL